VRHLRCARYVSSRRNMGSPARREPYGDGVAVVAAGVTPCRGAEESSVQDEGRQANRLTLMRRREMRRGQRERSGNWRAGCLETSTSGSEEGGWKRAARAVPRQPPISYLAHPFSETDEFFGRMCQGSRHKLKRRRAKQPKRLRSLPKRRPRLLQQKKRLRKREQLARVKN
jgi:hypothetical protein